MTDHNALELIDQFRIRLLKMADDPPFRFIETSHKAAERYQALSKTFEGYEEVDIDAEEQDLGLRFPSVYRAFLRRMGRKRGQLFTGTNIALLSQVEEYRSAARELMGQCGCADQLPKNAVVVAIHQGYSLIFFVAEGGYDSPVFQFTDSYSEPKLGTEGLATSLEAEVSMMEDLHRRQHESGGYFLKLHPGGGATQKHPARCDNERPLDFEHELYH